MKEKHQLNDESLLQWFRIYMLSLGVLLAILSLPLLCFLFAATADTKEALELLRTLVPICATVPTAAVACLGIYLKRPWFLTILAAVVWGLVSWGFVEFHERVWLVRTTIPNHARAYLYAQNVNLALHEYASDCGGFPTQQRGLRVLVVDSEIDGWAGPYVEDEWLTDPLGSPMQYQQHDTWVDVWSNGPDRQSGSSDDIRAEVSPRSVREVRDR